MVVKWNTRGSYCWQPSVCPLNHRVNTSKLLGCSLRQDLRETTTDSESIYKQVKLWTRHGTRVVSGEKEVARIHRQHDKVVMRPTGLLAHADHSAVTLIWDQRSTTSFLCAWVWWHERAASLCEPTDMQLISAVCTQRLWAVHAPQLDGCINSRSAARMPECLLCEPSWFESSRF